MNEIINLKPSTWITLGLLLVALIGGGWGFSLAFGNRPTRTEVRVMVKEQSISCSKAISDIKKDVRWMRNNWGKR